MVAEVKLTPDDEQTLLNAVFVLKRFSIVAPQNPLASVAGIAASKVNDVLQQAANQQPADAPF
jgi:hypothetical protein